MKVLELNYKLTAISSLMVLGTFLSCQVEDVSSDTDAVSEDLTTIELASKIGALHCERGGMNSERTIGDMARPVNFGKIDDRSCYSNYSQTKIGSVIYGNYNIAAGSNHLDTSLQPRIERSLPRANSNVGSFVEFKGKVRILEVGKTKDDKHSGTYIAQAKGKHTGGGGSPDPAICLFLAKPVYGKDAQGRWTQVSFDIYREQIKTRGGSGDSGRKLVLLTNIKKGVGTSFELKVGFRKANGKKVHYANAKIGGKNFFWDIPEPYRGRESGIRYGAYRVKGGIARIQWASTSFTRVSK